LRAGWWSRRSPTRPSAHAIWSSPGSPPNVVPAFPTLRAQLIHNDVTLDNPAAG
jgi:hypothetical protein